MTSRHLRIPIPSALAETVRLYPLCILTAFVTTADLLSYDFSYTINVMTAASALPTVFGALAGALAFQNASPGKRLLAHGFGFALGLAGGYWSLLSFVDDDGATALAIGLLAHLVAALCAGHAAGGGRSGFWRANVLGLTSLIIGVAVFAIGLVGVAVIFFALDALLHVRSEQTFAVVYAIGTGLLCPIIALTGLRPSALADAGRPGAGYLAVLATVTDALLIPLMIALALVIHIYAGTILMKAALPDGGIGWVATTYLVAGYGIYLFADGLPVRFARLRRLFRLAWVPGTALPLLLLGLATFARIDQYGITEERYGLALVVIAGSIFLVVALIQRPFDIRIVPLTAAILAGIAAVGPLGPLAMTIRSQLARGQAILVAVTPDQWAMKGDLPLGKDQRETLQAVMEALENRRALAALTESPSWPAGLSKTWQALSNIPEREIPREIPSVPRRSSNFPWDVFPLASTTLIPSFKILFPGKEGLRSPTGRWILTARDNRLILDEDGRETVFDLSIILREQPAGMAPTMITIQSDSGRSGTLVVRGFESIVGESGAPGLLHEIRGSILLQNAPTEGAN